MAGEWRHTKLGDVVEINPEALGSDWPYDHIRYVDISSVGEGFLIELPRHLIITDAPSRAKRLVRSGDTILSTVRPNRRSMYFVKESSPDLVVSTGFAVLRPRENLIEPRYLYACVFDKNFTEYLVSREKGAAYPAVLPEDIADAVINLPPLPEQRTIAAVLGALDDKIELNRRMNRTLEAIAQAVFRHWFVENEEAEGWEVVEIKDVCEKIENGGTPRRDRPEFWEPGTIPWLTSGEVKQEIIVATENRISEEGFKNSSAKMWKKGTTVVALYGATAGQVSFIAQELCANQACCGLIPDHGWQYFVYLTLSSAENSLSLQARGSAQQNLSQQIVADFPIRRPDNKILDEFNQIVEPLFEKWIANLKQSRTLAALRDALLPKLMRGEVRATVHE